MGTRHTLGFEQRGRGLGGLILARVIRSNGEVRDAEISASLMDLAGVRAVRCILRDVTEHKRHEAKRRALEARLQRTRRLESIEVLTGGIAHDFNGILAGIVGSNEIALEALGPDSPAASHIRQA